jgi:hypothetical protein
LELIPKIGCPGMFVADQPQTSIAKTAHIDADCRVLSSIF